jgi:aspartate/methionine/tyrosine aminotransferase
MVYIACGSARPASKIAGDYPYLDNNPERVIVTGGSQEALYLALLSLVDEGDEVLLPNPGFVAYPTIVKMAGVAWHITKCLRRKSSCLM